MFYTVEEAVEVLAKVQANADEADCNPLYAADFIALVDLNR